MEEVSLTTAVNSAALKSTAPPAAVQKVEAEDKTSFEVAGQKEDREQPAKVSKETAKQVVKKVNDLVNSFSTKISFDIDPESSQSIIRVTEKESGKIIRQIPSEEMLHLMRKMEEISGIIFHRRA